MHFYDPKSRRPCHEVPNKSKGGMRATTIADARKLALVPGTTDICACAAKPGLERWDRARLLDIAAEHAHIIGTDGWKDEILGIAKTRGEKVMGRGTEIHNKLERIFSTGVINQEDPDVHILEPVISEIEDRFKGVQWTPEKIFVARDGFGGSVDLSSSSIIVDFKTKDSDKLDSSIIYDTYLMQLAAYSRGLQQEHEDYTPWGNHFRCFNLFISLKKPGLFYWHEWTKDELERGWNMFKYLLEFWKLKNNYDPSFGNK